MLSAKVTRRELIKKWPAKLTEVNRQFLPAAGIMVLGDAMRRTPGDMATLEGSLNMKVGTDDVRVGTNLKYAPYVEYGTGIHAEGGNGRKTPWTYYNEKLNKFFTTKGMKAQPFLRPALDENRKNLLKLWKQIFRRVYGR